MRFGVAPFADVAEEPVTLTEAKAHLRLDVSDDDALVTELIVVARKMVERDTGRCLVTQTWDGYLDSFPCGPIEVPRAPLSSVTSILYTDANGDSQTLSASDYRVDAVSVVPRIEPAWGIVWPVTRGMSNDARVRMVFGYGAAAAVPSPLKHAMKLIIGSLYEFRESTISGTIVAEVPLAASRLLAPYRIPAALFAA